MATILKKEAKKFMARVPKEHVFYCQDGRILKNSKELGQALSTMADETFKYHANSNKSDFSNWVKDIITDQKLAKDLTKATTREDAANSVKSRVAYLSTKI